MPEIGKLLLTLSAEMKRISIISAIILTTALAVSAKKPVVAPSYAWKIVPPLGLREESSIDTLLLNYAQESIPSARSIAYATTGNSGAEGETLIFFDRKPASAFFFRDALSTWLPSEETMKFYNTRIPMTLLSYNTGGGKDNAQDRLKATFSGNVNKKLQIGAMLDYIYSKGSYNNQAAKNLIWGFSGSYISDRIEFQGYYNHYNSVNKENGGITDDLYITDPAEIQGGSTSVDTKTIPTNLTAAHSRVVGGELYLNTRYKVGFYRDEPREEDDTVARRTYVPVSSFIWTLKYNQNRHEFINTSSSEDRSFWENSYLSAGSTHDRTSYWQLRNTFGISLLEGFNKYAKAGLSAFITHEIRRYTQTPDSIDRTELPEGLSPYPYENLVAPKATENLMWAGAQLTKQQGSVLNYEATAEIGFVGRAAGEVKANGHVDTRLRLLGDTVTLSAYGAFRNESTPYLLNHYVSNHFIWENDFGMTRTVRAGGNLDIPHTRTNINVGIENIQNYVFFNSNCMPEQHSGNVQVFSATLRQDFKAGILHWNNRVTYQTSSDQNVIPMPSLAVYSNLYILFRVATLHVQLGVDCDYYTKYKSVAYQPATMSFYNQKEVECGNYPFMNAYINMKLSKARFYVLFSHVNQGLTGNNYFSMPHYPLNPRRFQIGVSVDLTN